MDNSNSKFQLNLELAKGLGFTYEIEDEQVFVDGKVWEPTDNWDDCGWLKDYYTIGSEGASAWGWTETHCYGFVGDSEKEAICLTAIKLQEVL